MPFSHHSHSGQFCHHAKNTLEEMVLAAIARGMLVYSLTEHMPRTMADLYPEETSLISSTNDFVANMESFYDEAVRLREKYKDQLKILIGFESEWIRPEQLNLIRENQSRRDWDFFVGSLHHVHTIPIDFDRALYEKACNESGGTDEKLFEDYFDEQLDMLQALKPQVVGHFDLIRLHSDDSNQVFSQYKQVWSKVERNLAFIQEYGGALEINSASLRKGMNEPYPSSEICQAFLKLGGKFVLSDDAHSVGQVGLNYHKVKAFIQKTGITELHYLTREPSTTGLASFASASVESLESNKTWS